METVAYRSFLVRAWARGRQTVRVLVEEVQSGRRIELRGDRAARLVAEIQESLLAERTVEATDVPPEGPGDRS